MNERIYSPESVKNGNGKIKLQSEVPTKYTDIPNNPDGTRPSVTIDVDSSSALHSLQALSLLRDEQLEEVLSSTMMEHLSHSPEWVEIFAESEDDSETNLTEYEEKALMKAMDETFVKVHYPEFSFEVSLLSEDEKDVDVKISLMGPSYLTIYEGFMNSTENQKLGRVAAAFMPSANSDDYDWGNAEDEDWYDGEDLGYDDDK